MFIGAHVKTESTYLATAQRAQSEGCNSFAFFVRSPQGGSIRTLDENDLSAFNAFLKESGFGPCVPHAPYIYNLASDNEKTVSRTITSLRHDFDRIALMDDMRYNIHPGAHKGQGMEAGVNLVQRGVNEVLEGHPKAVLLLETMAGKGSEIGGTFEELAAILEGVERQDQVGICLDTCHIYDAGYDIKDHYDLIFDEFDKTIGLNKLLAIHLNDSIYGLESRKDRHAELGLGELGLDTFRRILTDERFSEIPFIMETPEKLYSHAEQIALAKRLASDEPLSDIKPDLERETKAREAHLDGLKN